jgi:predicted PolB exonuclease-like 3'-5' exonuclease
MVRLYLDLETYRPRKEGSFVEERIISSGLLIDETPFQEASLKENVEPILINEWDGLSEPQIISKVQDQIREAWKNHRFTVICGFNILRFDIPLLICRCVQHSLGKPDEAAKMWNDCFTVDYFQQLLVANGIFFKGMTLEKIVEVSEKLGFNPPPYSTGGNVIKELYDQSKYKEIEEHLKQDLLIVRWLDLYGAKRLIERSMKEGKALFRE